MTLQVTHECSGKKPYRVPLKEAFAGWKCRYDGKRERVRPSDEVEE